jgi:hypothetical protein
MLIFKHSFWKFDSLKKTISLSPKFTIFFFVYSGPYGRLASRRFWFVIRSHYSCRLSGDCGGSRDRTPSCWVVAWVDLTTELPHLLLYWATTSLNWATTSPNWATTSPTELACLKKTKHAAPFQPWQEKSQLYSLNGGRRKNESSV